MDIEKVNSMDFGEFVDVFGNVIERCPLIAAAVWSQRPFSDLEDLEKHLFAFIDALPQSGLGDYEKLSSKKTPRQSLQCLWDLQLEKGKQPQSGGQEGILRCHPDLAGRELQRGTLSAESQREQRGAGLTSLDADERLRLAELNAQYRARFGFPFVLAARLSDRAAVQRELAARLHCPPAQELRTALGEVKKIGHLRLADLLGADQARA
ncbi:putative 2-oxo-4-hydroxy-4-carboxy-5-ureidoimidazoline decarboxylase isoform X1 [Ursus americanus]|uniref:putative 2-oxo-4-hydroxy-4-carboxy-5-ureidoimidazoline decarboxylase isoform X1 n=1 Tax=Ursus arctos TaxID=9644 RepID=UPI000E6DC443|nr:putative 2-oxo-4-hydroxy-4-carboxy-5-ureidoimidazoline decarboxylase isoform X1 [Ursus arctos]XP_045652686.1 putative 2-oxo-4-hydroxy-4-carboxy-5-ureidoimidazoline decarboxylase isoform X1 [Ursus americanus]